MIDTRDKIEIFKLHRDMWAQQEKKKLRINFDPNKYDISSNVAISHSQRV